MDDTSEELKDVAKLFGKLGGQATVRKHGTEHFKSISALANEKRWSEHRKKKAQEAEKETEK